MKERFEGHAQACSRGGVTQAEKFYVCPHCGDVGATNKMLYHIKICDGTGLKNYWAKKRSEWLKRFLGL